MSFAGNLIPNTNCEFYYDDVIVTSFIDTAYESVPKELRSVGSSFSMGKKTQRKRRSL